jgi:ATP phosphoribosyltransferase regulatory subunit
MEVTRWLLPEGISEALPEEAARLEYLRRRLLDVYACWGYEMVIPPFIEYLESLLTGTGADLDLQTFKITDQLSGRLLGIRADMTPQVARIEAHRLKREEPVRLCYLGTVLHTRPDGFARSRAPLQIGAELYGHAGIESDAEILNLMLETLRETGIDDFQVDLGHAAIYRSLVTQAGLDAEREQQLFAAMQRKAAPELHAMLSEWHIATADLFNALIDLNGEAEILNQARSQLAIAPPAVHAALDDLEKIIAYVDSPRLHIDLAELRGFSYHTGVIFAAYVPNHGEAIAQGGRYDHIGEVFGRARPATGFSVDLKTLVMLNPQDAPASRLIFAPADPDPDPSLAMAVRALRAQGQAVRCGLPGAYNNAAAMGCDAVLQKQNGIWAVVDLLATHS